MSDLLNSASLVLIPSGYKEDVVYSAVPTDGSGDLSFTRASNGTRVNSAGLVEVVAWNLMPYSEDFSNAVYSKKAGISLTANATTAPNGTNTATRMYANTNSAIDYGVFQILPSQSATLSVYAKKGELNYVYLGFNNDAASEGVFFNLNTGAISQNTGSYSASIESVGNGWYRCIAYFPTISYCFISPSVNGTSFVFTDQLNNGLFIWGAQLNIGSTAKPYFPTTDRLNVPRLTYQNGGGGCPSLLLEKQSTNYFTYSEELQTGTSGTITVTPNTAISPDGTQNADSLGAGYLTKSLSATAGTWTFSTFAKYLSANTVQLYIYDGGYYAATFNVSTGVVTSSSAGVTASIQNMGNGWYRCIFTATTANNVSEVGFGSGNVYAWGCQFEMGSYATSYIGPTTSASATRVADACYKTGISSLIGQTQGTIFVDFLYLANSGNNRFSISDGSNINWIFIGMPEDGALRTNRFYIKTSGVVRVDVGSYSTGSPFYTVGQRYKLALAYKSGDWAVYGNGTLLYSGTDAIASVSSPLSVFDFFNATGGVADAGEQINQTALFSTRLSNSELASLTSL